MRDDNIKNGHLLKNKIAVPIVDEDVSVTYYAIVSKDAATFLSVL